MAAGAAQGRARAGARVRPERGGRAGSSANPSVGPGALVGRPFGRDESGAPIDHGSGQLVAAAVRTLREEAADRAARDAATDLTPEATQALLRAAGDEAVDQLIAMLNAAIPDGRYHVTEAYLLDEGHRYSYEFRLFVAAYARTISGDPGFYAAMGRRAIPGAIVALVRPLGVRQTFAILPRITAKYVRTDLRVIRTSATTALLRWQAASQLALVPAAHHAAYLEYACRSYQGTFAAIPTALHGLAPATVRETSCQLDGAAACEWEFSWSNQPRGAGPLAVVASLAASAAVFSYLVAGLPYADPLAIIGATLLPAGMLLYGRGARRLAAELRDRQALLLEQREVAEHEFDRSEGVNAELQVANLELRQRLSELMALNAIAVAVSATLDIDELLDESLGAIVRHLRFDRALVLLADDRRGVLAGGRSVGTTPEMAQLIASLEVRVDDPDSHLAALFRAPGPGLFRDVDRDTREPNRRVAEALGVTSFLGTPLVTQGRTVGILAVDNRASGREVEPGDGPLLFTVGNLVANAIETARLVEAVEDQNRALESRVAQRTADLARATVIAEEARSAAEAASETKSSFLANVSHELRTPLTSVVGFTRIVQRRLDEIVYPAVANPDPKVARAMRQVEENLAIMAAEGERLTTMINEVLDLAKIESGKVGWKTGPVQLDEVIARATAATASIFEQTGLALDVRVSDDLPELTGDRDRLIQVVINLLSNAVKFTPAGCVSVTADRRGSDVEVGVADTGIGIAPEDHASVFEEFRQAGDTLKDKPQGTGLGLPISRQIVEHHGGRLWLESAAGSGSTFRFTLPIHAASGPGSS